MTKTTTPRKLERVFALILTISFIVALAMYVSGVPQGADIVGGSNSTEPAPTSPAGSRADDGGTITVLNLDSTQQNDAWKAYVGNVSGRLTLDDAVGNTIYDWSIASANIQGEIYVSRNDSVYWANVSCADSAVIAAEHTTLSMGATDVDNLNNTFNYSEHAGMQVGVNSIGQDTCQSTATFINDTSQNVNNLSLFQEILLRDQNANLVYATFIDQDEPGYKDDGGNTTYDFQILIGENDISGTPTTYYFYLEIGS